jgi:hypothetical protein
MKNTGVYERDEGAIMFGKLEIGAKVWIGLNTGLH